MRTPASEDALKAIYALCAHEPTASTSSLADRLGVAAPSATGMVKRLAEQGLVEHVPYYGARLTSTGEAEALRLIRRHRILELFLVEVLGYTWDRVHEEAERLEHAASDELIDRLAVMLGEPECDPHGAPIPRRGRKFVDRPLPSLAQLETGVPAVLRRVSDEDPEALRYLADLNLKPGVEVEVLERAPFGGPLRIRVGTEEHYLGVELLGTIQVEKITASRRVM